jgi:CubicO group peptidase (beta-lactamase class C family)
VNLRDWSSDVCSSDLAITTLQAISEGKFDFDDRIAKIWPEFGCENKEKVTVKELLEHSVGCLTPIVH